MEIAEIDLSSGSKLSKPREIIIEIMDYMIKTGLTDYTGGNMALRVGERIYNTQTRASIEYRWKIHPDDIIVTDIDMNIIEGRKDKLSSEADLHHGILKRFPEINCTLHGNTHYSPLVVSAGLEIEVIRTAAKELNIKNIAVVPKEYLTYSNEEKEYIYNYFNEMRKRGEAMAVIMHDHGTLVAAKDHDLAFVVFNAVEANSRYIFEKELLMSNRIAKHP